MVELLFFVFIFIELCYSKGLCRIKIYNCLQEAFSGPIIMCANSKLSGKTVQMLSLLKFGCTHVLSLLFA